MAANGKAEAAVLSGHGESWIGVLMLPSDQNSDLEHYKLHWRLLLRHLLGWSEDQISEWIAGWCRPELGSLLSHETPQYYVVPQLIPRELRTLPLRDHNMLIAELDGAIRDSAIPETNDKYDWDAAKARIATILSRYVG
jgi:hypothetical protein